MKKTILFSVLAALCLFFKVSAQELNRDATLTIIGKVTDQQNRPLPGATVQLKGSSKGATTDESGNFTLANLPNQGVLQITFVGFQRLETSFSADMKTPMFIRLKEDNGTLNEVQVIGYGQTTRRLNTGSQSTLNASEIQKQPVTNVISALSGRAPGVFVQTTNGLPGGNINIQIRGKGSVTAGTNPLYIVDGVPLGNTIGGNYNSAGGNLSATANGPISPLNSLNPDDIESITVLKDADATAIYGSRASNGVVLITTKKGKSGKTKVDVNFNQGTTRAANLPKLLSPEQYLEIRKEAYKNDGTEPSGDPNSENYAPDLFSWKNGQSTDWSKYLIGNSGHFSDGQFSVSGGNENTSFNIGVNYRTESSYLAGHSRYNRGGVHFTLQHTSPNKRLFVQLSNSVVLDNNQLSNPLNISTDIILPPDYPLYDESGNFNWYYVNPAAELLATSKSSTDNIVENILVSYKLFPGLTVKASGGFNQIGLKQTQLFPTASLYPGSVNYTNFGNNSNRTYLFEPQITYEREFKSSKLNLLAGGTYQQTTAQGEFINASDFSSESLMIDFSSARAFTLLNNYTQYKYVSVFGRATYNILEKYIVNATARRDGSSRFGPGKQFGNFGSLGAAWLFGEENFVKNAFPFLSYGKLRGSYGFTGNDQITDYQYLSAYGSSGYVYGNIPGLAPKRIANGDFHWETTRKLDFAIEIGLFHNRLMVTADRYVNRSNDQLVSYKLPYLTGFSFYQANLPAVVQNSGWELELNTKNIQSKDFSWSSTFNLTVPRNKLVSFENFETSSYAQTLKIGYDITRIYGYQFLGVDPATGLPNYADEKGRVTDNPYFFNTIGKRTPDLYGGIGNTIVYKNWQIDLFGQFAKQKMQGGIIYPPGIMLNSYAAVLSRWQKEGDQTSIPKATNFPDGNYGNSTANFFDASYFRLKNISLSYTFKGALLKNTGISGMKVFVLGQNLYTAWHKNAALADPESGALSSGSPNLPPAKALVFGFQLTL